MAGILESAMLVAFGAAWPAALAHNLRRTSRGTSLSFLLIVLAGYVCGISAKLISGRLNYVFFLCPGRRHGFVRGADLFP